MTLRTRDLREDDRWQLLEWRNQARIREVSVDDRPIEREQHATWFDRVLSERSGQILVPEVDGRAVGVVQLEHVELDQGRCGWGCYLGDTDVPPGVGAVLPVIGLALGFERWQMRRMEAQVLGINKNMRGVHRRLEIAHEGTLRAHVLRADGTAVDVHLFGVLANEWPTVLNAAMRLIPSALRADLASIVDGLRARSHQFEE